MKLFFMSDIHGSKFYLDEALKCVEKEKPQYIIILGDELYHGPRNDLPKEYNPKEVAKTLNKLKDKVVAVRGNCDGEVDQMLIEYPIMSDYNIILYNNKRLFLTHGHVFNKDNMPYLSEGDVFIYGHTHIPVIEKNDKGITFINSGSISIPKGGSSNSYGILENDIFTIKTLNGEEVLKAKI